jgi:ABC-type multidrug transport system fused ATPase/permease subunit
VLNGTVRDNIAFGAQHGSHDDVRKAARLAEIAHIIERLPQGNDTVIGRGSSVSMSGGQLARLGLARALCRRPRLLLLDEVTSPLDPEMEGQVLTTFRALSSQLPLTIVLCTHSVVTASTTDRVVVLADGVVAEIGP